MELSSRFLNINTGETMKKFLKWGGIAIGALFVLSIILYYSKSPEERAKMEAERRTKDSISQIETAKQDSINAIKTAEKAEESYEADNMQGAFKTAKYFVQENLKAPSTAQFIDDNAKFLRDGKRWSYYGKVDSQNSFGAMIRSEYIVVIEHKGGNANNSDNWELISVQIK